MSCRREKILRRSKPPKRICYLTSKPYCQSWRRVLLHWRGVDGLKKKYFLWLGVSFQYLGVPVMEDALKLVFPGDGPSDLWWKQRNMTLKCLCWKQSFSWLLCRKTAKKWNLHVSWTLSSKSVTDFCTSYAIFFFQEKEILEMKQTKKHK